MKRQNIVVAIAVVMSYFKALWQYITQGHNPKYTCIIKGLNKLIKTQYLILQQETISWLPGSIRI